MKKRFALALALAMLFSSYGGYCLAEEPAAAEAEQTEVDISALNQNKEAYALFDRGEPTVTKNWSISYGGGGYTPEKIGDKYALKRDKGSDNTRYFYITTDNDFLSSEEGTPVQIDVEYFDKGNGYFTISYDGANNKLWWDTATVAWSDAEKVQMTDSNEWKTHTFIIEDMSALQRFSGYDMRFAMWSHQCGMSTGDIPYINELIDDDNLWLKLVQGYSQIVMNNKPYELPTEEKLAKKAEELEMLKNRLKKLKPCDAKEDFLLAAEGMVIMTKECLKLKGKSIPNGIWRSWYERYSKRWLAESKPSEIGRIKEFFELFDRL